MTRVAAIRCAPAKPAAGLGVGRIPRPYPRGPEGAVPDLRMDAGSLCRPADHLVDIGLAHRAACGRFRARTD